MLHCAVIEVRQRLCCANIFLKFKESLNDSESLKINVDECKVRLRNPKCSAEVVFSKYFSIVAGSFSNLIVDAENASFRISIKEIQISQENSSGSRDHIKINLKEQDETSLQCKNCESILIAEQKYEKIREFPSGAIDVSEFFCHHGPSFKDVLVPATKDLFYGFEFIVVNSVLIEKFARQKEIHLYCKRCLKYLGESIFNGKAAKLWSDSLRFSLKGNHIEIFATNSKSKIHQLMLKVIEETSLPAPEPLLRNMHFTKVLLVASFPNRNQKYLLVHILEKHLPVLRNNEQKTGEYKNTVENIDNYQHIELKLYKAFKILYRVIAKDENNDESLSWPPLLEYWQQDINILKMNISPFLFNDLNKELNNNILILPEIYRRNNDEFLLSYIFY